MKFAGLFPVLLVSVQMLTAPAFGQEKPPQDAQAKQRPSCAEGDKRAECSTKPARRSRYSPPVTVDLVPAPPLPRTPQPSSPPSPQTGAARAPAAVNNCDAGGCWGADGNRYHGGTGDTYLDSSGRQCRRIGTWMQCN